MDRNPFYSLIIMSSSTIKSNFVPFSLDHLLLNGLIINRGQLSPTMRTELNWRTFAGELIHEYWWVDGIKHNQSVELWRLPNVQTPEHLLP